MTFLTELKSLMVPTSLDTAPAPISGSRAPSNDILAFPDPAGRPVVITFLRHCGCPFAEKTFRALYETAKSHEDITFIAVSHSFSSHTTAWVDSLGLNDSALPNLRVIVDESRVLYATWGLGTSSFFHWMSPSSLWGAIKMGREEGIWNRPTESGSRWQTSGSWAVDAEGIVKWGASSERADDERVWRFAEALNVLTT